LADVSAEIVGGSENSRYVGSDKILDPQWLMLDMGGEILFITVELCWQTAYGKSYNIDISDHGATWITVYSETNGRARVAVIDISGNSGRCIRMYGHKRGTIWGYSLLDFKVLGDNVPPPLKASWDRTGHLSRDKAQ
jgi:hypothetical protein